MARSCTLCNGQKVIKNPQGNQYQQCPLCNGLGEDIAGGTYFEFGSADIVLGALGAADINTPILNGDFLLQFLVASSTGRFTCQLLDIKTQNPFSNIQLVDSILFGTAQNPMPVLTPYVFRQGGGIEAKVTDLSNAGNTLRLGFIGMLLPTK